MTQDIADDGFHEIQLSGKQLVFLFMATTVVSVVIFLCGVLVGRGVRSERTTQAADAALTTPAPDPTPVQEQPTAQASPVAEPPSPPADDELTYRQRLESERTPAEDLKPQASTGRVDARPDTLPTPEPEPVKPAPAASASASAAAAAAPPATAASSSSSPAAAQASSSGRWVVQLVALRDRKAANSIVQRLSTKGYPAFLVSPTASTPNQVFKVQVGRYADRGEAEKVASRLQKEEKFKPWISR
jgi:cell division septation protein DedD